MARSAIANLQKCAEVTELDGSRSRAQHSNDVGPRRSSEAGQVEMDTKEKIIYWHGELPPLAAEAMGEYIVEATSERVPGTLAHRDELWSRCFEDLMTQVRNRLEQEVLRLGGTCAHVLNESIDSKHDDPSGETWLHGRFTYMLYRRPVP
jgi:hypothetical protein